ncbi:virulence-associated E family protein, partial [Pseudogemmobacter blasticus]
TSFGQSRLMACAELVRSLYPDAEIIIAGDQHGDPMRGPDAARKAAAAVQGTCVLPPNAGEDWDDILRLRGAEAVREALCPVALDGEVLMPGEGVERHAIVVDNNGKPIWNMTNAITVLSTHYDWRKVFGFNKLTGKRVVFRALPGSGEKINGWRDLMDDDYIAVQAWFNRNAYPRATADITVNAVRAVSHAFSFDPLTDYLGALRWDGKPRIDTWLIDYLGVQDGPQRRAYGRKWLISAVARAYQPGCKADYMLVLEGEQGLRKSSVMRVLTGSAWFSDNLPPMGTKDASEHLAGRWIIEVAELDSMSRAGIETAKAFITRQTESFRPAYGRETISQHRRCVFVGTTNRDNWLNDSSGGRRFWPVRVGHINIELVTRDRDQIWAEAVAAYRSGERWWLEGEIEALARQDQAERLNTDPWQPDIAGYLSGKAHVAIADILWECLMIEKAKRTRGDSSRVTVVLQSLGWRRDGQFTSGTNKGQARYAPAH